MGQEISFPRNYKRLEASIRERQSFWNLIQHAFDDLGVTDTKSICKTDLEEFFKSTFIAVGIHGAVYKLLLKPEIARRFQTRSYPIAYKSGTVNEIRYTTRASELTVRGISPNFNMVYRTMVCAEGNLMDASNFYTPQEYREYNQLVDRYFGEHDWSEYPELIEHEQKILSSDDKPDDFKWFNKEENPYDYWNMISEDYYQKVLNPNTIDINGVIPHQSDIEEACTVIRDTPDQLRFVDRREYPTNWSEEQRSEALRFTEALDNIPNWFSNIQMHGVPKDIMLMEFTEKTLYQFKGRLSIKHLWSLIVQIILNITLCYRLDIIHNDLHQNNVMIQKVVPKKLTYAYTLNGVTYYVPLHGYLAKIIDFSQSTNDRYADGYGLPSEQTYYSPGFGDLSMMVGNISHIARKRKPNCPLAKWGVDVVSKIERGMPRGYQAFARFVTDILDAEYLQSFGLDPLTNPVETDEEFNFDVDEEIVADIIKKSNETEERLLASYESLESRISTASTMDSLCDEYGVPEDAFFRVRDPDNNGYVKPNYTSPIADAEYPGEVWEESDDEDYYTDDDAEYYDDDDE